MENKDQPLQEPRFTTTRDNYLTLIELIENTVEKLCNDRSKLLNTTYRGNMAQFRALMEKDELVKSVSKNQWVLDQIAERNFERHKELVNLIQEKCELRRQVLKTTKTASGIKSKLDAENKLREIENKIESIIINADN